MDFGTLLGIGHIIGVALGVGGATVSDIFFIRILKSQKITKPDFDNLKVLSRVVWSGITILIASGLAFLWRMYDASGSIGILNSDRFLAKLTLVAVVTINGLVFHFIVFPKLKAMVGKTQELKEHIRLFAITGAISGASWYSIVLLAMLRGVDLPYWGWMGAYAAVLTGGIITARLLIGRLLNR